MKNFYEEAFLLLQECQKIMSDNQDLSPMEIGDRIIVWDGSYNCDYYTGEERLGVDKLFEENIGIIIETACAKTIKKDLPGLLEKEINLDLLIAIGDTKVYVASGCVKHKGAE